MAFDYTTSAEVFAYGGSAGGGVDPVDEQSVMADLVTKASRAVDRHCRQAFSAETYTGQRLRGVVDVAGDLVCSPPVPAITTITALEYRTAGTTTWTAATLAAIDVVGQPHGCAVRWIGAGLTAIRGRRIDVRMSYTGGYADLAALPADLRLAATGVAWHEYQRRSAPMDKTAMPSMGIVVIPGDWPPHITSKLAPFCKVIPA